VNTTIIGVKDRRVMANTITPSGIRGENYGLTKTEMTQNHFWGENLLFSPKCVGIILVTDAGVERF
jgi:hypothetical protein